jgi:tRNA (cytidine/uridine-2'-O-)-methyltransferase
LSKVDHPKFFNIVLIEPEIPNNTGNIGRTCVGTNSRLHLVGKLGFELTDKYLKRAGLDYWKHLDWTHHKTWDDWWLLVDDPSRVFYFSTKASKTYFDCTFQLGDWLVFGRETKGLDEEILRENDAQALTIPQYGPIRSLNVANAVSIVVYEAIRQLRPTQGKIE